MSRGRCNMPLWEKWAYVHPKNKGAKSLGLNYNCPGFRGQLHHLLCHFWKVTQPLCTPVFLCIKWALLELISGVAVRITWGKGHKHLASSWHTVSLQEMLTRNNPKPQCCLLCSSLVYTFLAASVFSRWKQVV